MTGGEPDALEALSEMASSDLDLARLVVGLRWFTDGVGEGEAVALARAARYRLHRPGLGEACDGAPLVRRRIDRR